MRWLGKCSFFKEPNKGFQVLINSLLSVVFKFSQFSFVSIVKQLKNETLYRVKKGEHFLNLTYIGFTKEFFTIINSFDFFVCKDFVPYWLIVF